MLQMRLPGIRRCAVVSFASASVSFATQLFGQQHDHAAAKPHDHAGKPVECRTLAAPPWSGLPADDLRRIRELQASLLPLRQSEAARQSGFRPTLGDIPTMGVHWVNQARMRDGVNSAQPDHLLFTRIAGRDSLVGVAFAFRGPVDATIPTAFASELAQWHNHPELGGGAGQTLHMLHVWFVPSPYGPFAGNNFFLPFMGAGLRHPDPCWIQSDADIDRLEMIATVIDLSNRGVDSTGSASAPPMFGRRDGRLAQALAGLSERVQPSLRALDSAAARSDRAAWERVADQTLADLRPGERMVLTAARDRIKGIQSATAPQRRR